CALFPICRRTRYSPDSSPCSTAGASALSRTAESSPPQWASAACTMRSSSSSVVFIACFLSTFNLRAKDRRFAPWTGGSATQAQLDEVAERFGEQAALRGSERQVGGQHG